MVIPSSISISPILGQLNCILIETYQKIIPKDFDDDASIRIKIYYNDGKLEMGFELKLDETFVPYKTLCKSFPYPISSAEVSNAKINLYVKDKTSTGIAWGAKSIQIPNYAANGNVNYETYSLAPPEPRFWLSTDSQCEELNEDFNMYPCCQSKKSCRLYSKGKKFLNLSLEIVLNLQTFDNYQNKKIIYCFLLSKDNRIASN